MALLQTRDLDVVIGQTAVCSGLNLDIQGGELWGLLGANGAGKTTLLHTLAGLRPAAGGQIHLQGQALAQLGDQARARALGIVFQDTPDPFPATVLQTAVIGRHPYLDRWQWESATDFTLARDALAAVGLDGFDQRMVSTLSGGERRRLALATLLVQDPAAALLDEPLNHLDLQYQVRVLELLRERCHNLDRVVVVSLHDVNLASHFCDQLILLGQGRTSQGRPDAVLHEQSIEQLYGQPVHRVATGRGTAYLPTLSR